LLGKDAPATTTSVDARVFLCLAPSEMRHLRRGDERRPRERTIRADGPRSAAAAVNAGVERRGAGKRCIINWSAPRKTKRIHARILLAPSRWE
jgi:hypothetical protein